MGRSVTWSDRSEDIPTNDVQAWLAWVTDHLPEGTKAIILLDLPDPEEGKGRGEMIAHDFADDEAILECWRRHLRAFQMNRVGPGES